MNGLSYHRGHFCRESRRHALTDGEWSRLAPLQPTDAGKRGRPYKLDHRTTIDGVLWVLVTWRRDPPTRYGDWRGNTHLSVRQL